MVNPHHLAYWYPTAAYLYVFWLDALALAWEYLRRHPDYRLDWLRRHRGPDTAHRWGLRLLEDPAQMRATRIRPGSRPCRRGEALPRCRSAQDAATFAFWRIPGHKQLLHDGKGLALIARSPGHCALSRSRPAWKTAWRGLCPPRRAAAPTAACAQRTGGAKPRPSPRAAGTAQLAGARRDPGGRVLA